MAENLKFHKPDGTPARCLIIVPAFNEAGSIAQVVSGLHEHLPEVDVLVVDDGSIDQTHAHVPKTATVVRLPFNLGIGGAMQTGYRYADMHRYDVAVQVDGDGQHPPAEVSRVIQTLLDRQCDMIVGSRFLEETKYEQKISRMTGIHLLRLWIKLLCGQSFSDCTSGFRAANRDVIKSYAHWYPDDYPEPEVLLLLTRSNFAVEEIQVHMEQRTTGQTSISLTQGIFYVLKVATALLLDTIRNPWPDHKGKTS